MEIDVMEFEEIMESSTITEHMDIADRTNTVDKSDNKTEMDVPATKNEIMSNNVILLGSIVTDREDDSVIEDKKSIELCIRNTEDEITEKHIIDSVKGITPSNNEDASIAEEKQIIGIGLSCVDDMSSDINSYVIASDSTILADDEFMVEEKQNVNIKSSKELGRLEISEPKVQIDSEYDTYGDDNKIYKKYRLRENRKKPNYRIPEVNELPKEFDVPKTVRCQQCPIKYNNYAQLRKHIRMNHKIIYSCLLCKQMFDTNMELINHKKIHEEENRTYLCYECKEAFSDHYDFLIHELSHSKVEKFYTCPECGNLYDHKRSYEMHITTHFNKPLKCPICSKEVNGEIYLKNHIKEHSSNFKCVECGLNLKDKLNYDAHLAIHTGVKIHQCLYCGKGFRLKHQKIIHTRIHTQERRFSCTKCDRKFLTSIDCERHIIKHDSEKKLQCKICDKRFKLKMDLASHMRVHSKEYKCPECNTKLSTIGGLKAHILHKHTNDRPEVCELCDMKFVNKSHLKRHFKCKSHKNNEFKNAIGKEKKS